MLRLLAFRLRQYSRHRRYGVIHRLLRVKETRGLILDLGGGPASYFASLFPGPDRVIVLDVNYQLVHQAKSKQSTLHVIVADGGRLPLADGSISVTVCNSVIEHIDDPEALAIELRRVSQRYFLQTPNGGFPLETHSFIAIPFYNLIPWACLRRLMCRIFGANFQYVSGVQYLTEPKLKILFPEATITYEKALGLKKSFYVYHINSNAR